MTLVALLFIKFRSIWLLVSNFDESKFAGLNKVAVPIWNCLKRDAPYRFYAITL